MKVFVIELFTRHWTFTGVAESKKQAIKMIRDGWALHREQTGAVPLRELWGSEWTPEEAIREVEVGTLYRDHEEMTQKEAS
jgi:hypothetical protein